MNPVQQTILSIGLLICLNTLLMLISIGINGQPIWVQLFCVFFFSGGIAHWIQLLVHELAHTLVSRSLLVDRILLYLANSCLVIPYTISFQRYHWQHHSHMGHAILDPDVPLPWEYKMTQNLIGRLCWVVMHPFLYVLRPFFKHPLKPSSWDVGLLLWMMVCNLTIYFMFPSGLAILLRLLGALLCSISWHPFALHHYFEHFGISSTASNVPKSNSYYGRMNWLTFNIGYHAEHHDNPRLSWDQLPQSKAPEYTQIVNEYFQPFFSFLSGVSKLPVASDSL